MARRAVRKEFIHHYESCIGQGWRSELLLSMCGVALAFYAFSLIAESDMQEYIRKAASMSYTFLLSVLQIPELSFLA